MDIDDCLSWILSTFVITEMKSILSGMLVFCYFMCAILNNNILVQFFNLSWTSWLIIPKEMLIIRVIVTSIFINEMFISQNIINNICILCWSYSWYTFTITNFLSSARKLQIKNFVFSYLRL
jgi:hypothetical protein